MHLNIDSNVPKIIKSDQDRLSKILFSLINNSLKYTQRGSIRVNVKIQEAS